MKTCKRCGESKPLTDFGKAGKAYRPYCKPCASKLSADYANKMRDDDQYRLKYQLRGVKKRAAEKGVPFDLRIEDLPPIPENCPALGIPLHRTPRSYSDNTPTLDRTVPHLGYIPGNIQWLSYRANKIKSDATHEELLRVTEWFGEQLRKTRPV